MMSYLFQDLARKAANHLDSNVYLYISLQRQNSTKEGENKNKQPSPTPVASFGTDVEAIFGKWNSTRQEDKNFEENMQVGECA